MLLKVSVFFLYSRRFEYATDVHLDQDGFLESFCVAAQMD